MHSCNGAAVTTGAIHTFSCIKLVQYYLIMELQLDHNISFCPLKGKLILCVRHSFIQWSKILTLFPGKFVDFLKNKLKFAKKITQQIWNFALNPGNTKCCGFVKLSTYKNPDKHFSAQATFVCVGGCTHGPRQNLLSLWNFHTKLSPHLYISYNNHNPATIKLINLPFENGS